MGICIHASILLQSPTSAPHSIPCRIHTYIYYAVTATIPFFVWRELARLLPSLSPSLAYENQQKEEHADGRAEGWTDGRTTAIPHISSRCRQRRRRRLRQRHKAQFPFLPLRASSFLPLRYPTYLFLATRSRHIAIAVCSTAAPHPYLASLLPIPSSLSPPPLQCRPMGALLNKTRTANEGAPNPTQSLSLLCFEIEQQNVQLEERHPNSNEYQFASESTLVCRGPHKWTTFWKEGKSICSWMVSGRRFLHFPYTYTSPLPCWCHLSPGGGKPITESGLISSSATAATWGEKEGRKAEQSCCIPAKALGNLRLVTIDSRKCRRCCILRWRERRKGGGPTGRGR